MIRLTDEEIDAVLDKTMPLPVAIRKLNKAQLKKVVEWGNERCPHHSNSYGPKRHCPKCWQALLEEIKE